MPGASAMKVMAALTGALALAAAAAASHLFGSDPDVGYLYLGVGAQLSSAAASLAVLPRADRLSRTSTAMLLVGANLFAGETWLGAHHFHALFFLAPIGGLLMLCGWLALAFVRTR